MKSISTKSFIAVILGNIILGIGIALLKISQMGNDPFSAMNMTISESFGIGLGSFQLMVNLALFTVQIAVGRKYIGLGSLINFGLLGYIVEFSYKMLVRMIGDGSGYTVIECIVVMLIAILILTFGAAMYQVSGTGVSPFDYIALGLTDKLPTPFFINRIAVDGSCVLIVLILGGLGIITGQYNNLGIGTISCAFCLGPFINIFSKFHEKWIL